LPTVGAGYTGGPARRGHPLGIGGPVKTILIIIVVVLVILFLLGKFRPGRR
jgi:hypothetical protein